MSGMAMSEIYLDMTFDAGHRIVGHEGKCARLHGHTYRVEIRAAGPVRGIGFVTDFGDLKEIVNRWDHKMLLWNADPWAIWDRSVTVVAGESEAVPGIIRLPFNPTAENMAQHLAEEILIGCDLLSVGVTLWETSKCSATAILEKATVMDK